MDLRPQLGGVQYLLKNVTANKIVGKFWVFSPLPPRTHLGGWGIKKTVLPSYFVSNISLFLLTNSHNPSLSWTVKSLLGAYILKGYS